MIQIFEPARLYCPSEPKFSHIFGNQSKMAQWRTRRFGPPYIKVGRKTLYKGSDLNQFLWDNRVETECGKRISAKQLADKVRDRRAKFEAVE